MTEEQKLVARFVETAVADLQSHKAALDRLAANQEAQHKVIQELAAGLNEQAKLLEDIQSVWTKNFEAQGALLNQQTQMLEVMRSIVLPDAVN